MSRIPLKTRGKRPRFFEQTGLDQMMSMMLEVMTELWVVKERVYTLEKVMEQNNIDLKDAVERHALNDEEKNELEQTRRKFVENILRTLETEFVAAQDLQQEIDQLTDTMTKNAGSE